MSPIDGYSSANQEPHRVTNQDAETFITEIQRRRHRGFGFVPFIGAGFSAPAGAPVIVELSSYLKRCIFMAVGVTDVGIRPWNPRTDQWPPFVDHHPRTENLATWETQVASKLDDVANKLASLRSFSHEQALLEEARGAMAEWRTALLFLSRLMHDEPGAAENNAPVLSYRLALDAPQHEIIDSFFRHVMNNKTPTLGHKMLAALAGVLRQDLLLTTNFDDLLERAFAAARNSVEVCEVHLGDSLPLWDAVSDTRTLIKIHGHRYRLRADYSLDALPSETDKQRFLTYLLSRTGRMKFLEDSNDCDLDFQNHLLVMGSSGAERRTRALIEYAWSKLNRNFRVFWLCHSADDVSHVRSLTQQFIRKDRARSTPKFSQDGSAELSVVLRYPDTGLFLFHMHQAIRRTLPPHAGMFPSVSQLPTPPMSAPMLPESLSSIQADVADPFQEQLLARLNNRREAKSDLRFVWVVSKASEHGVTTACADAFRELEQKKHPEHVICLWLDMNEISSAANLFEVLLEAAYRRLGIEHWTPSYVSSNPNRGGRIAEIQQLVESAGCPWVIFLNARETPGANTPNNPNEEPNGSSHGWLDHAKPENSEVDFSADTGHFLTLIKELTATTGESNISVILLCRGDNESVGLLKALHEEDKDSNPKRRLDFIPNRNRPAFDEARVVREALQWAGERESHRRFLHALVLMQQPRPLATIWSQAANPTAEPESADQQIAWVDKLERMQLVRRKMGGFVWIHAACRQQLRACLRSADEAQTHIDIAGWYEKVLDVSRAPPVVFEIAYHHCRSAEARLRQSQSASDFELARASVQAASTLLRTHGLFVQTRGYSKGSCRRLIHLRDSVCGWIWREVKEKPVPVPENSHESPQQQLARSLLQLQNDCTEMMRAIAREVGEDSKAFIRHQQCWEITSLLGAKVCASPWQPKLKGLSFPVPEILAEGVPDTLRSLRWLRWGGMLGIASRSLDWARSQLMEALQLATQTDAASVDQLWERVAEGKFPAQDFRIEVLRIAEQFIALELMYENLSYRSRDSQTLPSDVEKHIEHALALGDKIRRAESAQGPNDAVAAVWCQGRLSMHLSSCKGLRAKFAPESKKRMRRTAMGVLAEAEASLRISDPLRYRSELALVELHRAEDRLRMAESLNIPVTLSEGVSASLSVSKVCTALAEAFAQQPSAAKRILLRRQFEPAGDMIRLERWRRAQSLVSDAQRLLVRAEPALRDGRRNVWWTTWYLERRLRAIAHSVWLSVFERKTPIPFLGFEAAARGTKTSADSLLQIAQRMIRVDAYRLATIVDGYASCAQALQLRIFLENDTPHVTAFTERLLRMQKKISDAVDYLQIVQDDRNHQVAASGRPTFDQPLHASAKAVQDYIQSVSLRCRKVAAAISPRRL
jgi:hypothetical protein